MKAEIIAVGSELLLGQINNTNARYLSAGLAELGISVHFHTVVGDNPGRLEEAIRIAESRADLLIFTGGLGPTKDDLTKETIARHAGARLVYDDEALVSIRAWFDRMGREMTDNNKKQALILEGATVLQNHHGMAPGMLFASGSRHYLLLPGPPKEMEPMFTVQAKPNLARLAGFSGPIASRVFRFYGIGEAELEHRMSDLLDNQTNPTLAPLASDGEVTIRATAKAKTVEEAAGLLDGAEAEIRKIAGQYLYGYDEETLVSKAASLLIGNGLTISAAESLTAGLFMSELAEQPGISAALTGGVVTYTADSKKEQLGIPAALLEEKGVVSEETASAMAKAVREKFGTDYGVGLTGAAGPDPHDGKPGGTVWVAIASGEEMRTRELLLSGMRNTNRIRAVKSAMHMLIRMIGDTSVRDN
ncbi:competence/damage-inducible protein A [Bhargavaea beijingensis]|uniref:Putative competence-damage inducible protein n=1 Tax=Bhargavaea beijingensis TaxID=426756 RepID=A0A1G7ATB2_9BACL|nr:competence/damage-inducible protein A [Bhargavaea beijingensis]RSK24406.1 competence/damage-inducible protein A [Bhargavaea beijingensis]SDE18089.1 nicotinamide-nucleotide amidase [Bhargavaea beijingensis]